MKARRLWSLRSLNRYTIEYCMNDWSNSKIRNYWRRRSMSVYIICSVPQVRVYGVCLYSAVDLVDSTSTRSIIVNFHTFADDTQLRAWCLLPSWRDDLLPANLNTASRTLEPECPPFAWSWTQTRQSWAGSRFSHAPLGNLDHALLQLGIDTVTTSDHVRVLGITFSCDPSLEKHISNVCSTCFYGYANSDNVHSTLSECLDTRTCAFVTLRVD